MTTVNQMRLGALGLAALLALALAWGFRAPVPAGRPTIAAPTRTPAADRLARETELVARGLDEALDYSDFARKYQAADRKSTRLNSSH